MIPFRIGGREQLVHSPGTRKYLASAIAEAAQADEALRAAFEGVSIRLPDGTVADLTPDPPPEPVPVVEPTPVATISAEAPAMVPPAEAPVALWEVWPRSDWDLVCASGARWRLLDQVSGSPSGSEQALIDGHLAGLWVAWLEKHGQPVPDLVGPVTPLPGTAAPAGVVGPPDAVPPGASAGPAHTLGQVPQGAQDAAVAVEAWPKDDDADDGDGDWQAAAEAAFATEDWPDDDDEPPA